MRKIASLVPVGIATFALGWGLKGAGLPSSYLFAALLVGLAVALAFPARVSVPGAAFVAAQAVTGVALGAFVRSSALRALAHAWLPVTLVTAGTLLAPMVLAAVVVLAVPGGEFTVPQLLAQTAFALIGLQVGLRFTVETLRMLGRLLAPVLMSILALLVLCFGLALVLYWTTSVSLLDAYLATTPGGLFAVLAVAFGAGANTTFVLAVQGLRILVMVLLAPLVVRRLTRHPGARVAAG